MLKSHKRQFVDSSDPFFMAVQREILRFLGMLLCRDDLNNPLTAVSGIRALVDDVLVRKDLKRTSHFRGRDFGLLGQSLAEAH